MKRTKYISILIVMILIINIVINNTISVKAGNFNITVTQNTDEYGSVNINWSNYNYKDKNFKVYKSVDGGVTYETVGIDYNSVKEVKVLNIYPTKNTGGWPISKTITFESTIDKKTYTLPKSASLKMWMEQSNSEDINGYGKGIIKVTPVSISEFNKNPRNYLFDNNGDYKYNVIIYGTWNGNAGEGFNAISATYIENYIKSGKGFIAGHDTFSSSITPYNESISQVNAYYMNTLRKYFNITLANWDGTGATSVYGTGNGTGLTQDTLSIIKKGLFTTYPWYIGEVNDTLVVPSSHTTNGIRYHGTIWLKWAYGPTDNANVFLATYNNTAAIQTGDANCVASTDEQKILANLIFYMNQLLFNECDLKDSSAQDLTDPEITKINGMPNKIQIEATDKGNTYKYYVESYTKDDTTISGLLDRSEVKEVTVTTGVKGYRYLYSNNAKETITNNGTYITTNEIPINRAYKYIHVAPVDGAGNIGNTVSYEINDYLITTNASIGGIISNNHNVFKSESTSVFVSPMKGYEIENVVVDGVSVGKVETYNFINVDRNHTITAAFNKTSNWTNELNKMKAKYNWIKL